MSFNLDAWFNAIRDKHIDVDGALGAQCHDVFLSYLLALGGVKNDGHAPKDGSTHYVWTDFPNHRPGLTRIFTKHAGANIQRGDVVFYSHYPYAGTHVAVAQTGVRSDGTYVGIDQNPNTVQSRPLPTSGIVGVLRPKQHILGNTPSNPNNPTNPLEEEEMKLIVIKGLAGKRRGGLYAILNGRTAVFLGAASQDPTAPVITDEAGIAGLQAHISGLG